VSLKEAVPQQPAAMAARNPKAMWDSESLRSEFLDIYGKRVVSCRYRPAAIGEMECKIRLWRPC
jgi:hypothetical protein